MKGLLLCLLMVVAAPALAARHHMLIIGGIGGLDEYQQQFAAQTSRLYRAALDAGIDAENIIVLSAAAIEQPGLAHRLSDRAGIERALAEIGVGAQADDKLFVVLIGHGNPRGDDAVFNIPGPDISGADLDQMLRSLQTGTQVIINAASASGPFVKPLSGANRIVITATSSGREYHSVLFGEHFVAALAGLGADRDKDDRISMLEAFDYARREVRRAYESEKRLLTEHALLDDNGDGVGSLEAGEFAEDGGIASRVYLQPSLAGTVGASAELSALLEQKQVLEDSIRALKQRRAELQQDDYYEQLELLLVDLALLSRRIRSGEGS